MRTPEQIIRDLEARISALERSRLVLPDVQAANVLDHGALAGRADDDHTQYHTDARGDARYLRLTGGTLAGAGNLSVGGTLGVTGAATLSSTLGVTGTTTLSGSLTHGGVTHLPHSASTAAPSSPVTGQTWYETDTDRLHVWTGTAWQIIGGALPRIECRHSATVSVGQGTALPWDTEEYKIGITHAAGGSTFTVGTGLGGVYHISYAIMVDNTLDTLARNAWVDVNLASGTLPTSDTGRRYVSAAIQNNATNNTTRFLSTSGLVVLAAGDVVRVKGWLQTGTYTWNLTSRRDIAYFQMRMVEHIP